DNFFSVITPIVNTGLTQTYSNLTVTKQYRALVQNGVCASVYSAVVEITVNPNSAGGVISSADTVCISSNGGTLSLSGFLGTVIQWETSTDNFSTVIVPVSNTSNSFTYSNLTTSTYFRAQIQNTGCAIAYPAPVLITVDPVSVGGTLNNSSVVCANANSGTINLVGETGSILRWEISTDNFVSNISTVANTTNADNYLNLVSTTYYRTIVQSGVCAAAASNVVAVTVNPASVPGTIIGAKNVCVEGNGSSLVLVGYSGTILQWELSHDNFSTSAIIPNYTDTYNYTNITTPTSLRALVQYSPCPAVYSPAFDFIVNPATVGGMIEGNSVVEKNT
ncbi:MAG TPA: hypothetical protein VNZ45_01940, partial [Bacteroidia bacterium]|nr:hypothetical protein [Bacteroidia bacterium]